MIRINVGTTVTQGAGNDFAGNGASYDVHQLGIGIEAVGPDVHDESAIVRNYIVLSAG